MDNPISSSIVMALKIATEKTQMSRETKEKVDTIVNMAAASAKSIAKSWALILMCFWGFWAASL